jgi:hypothetical protein
MQAGPQGRPLLVCALWVSLAGLACTLSAHGQNAKKPKNKIELAKQAEDTFLDGIRADILGNTEKLLRQYHSKMHNLHSENLFF